MNTITKGHVYELANFENPDEVQIIQFIQKEPDINNPDKLITFADGTTNEEVLAMLIDRLQYLYDKLPDMNTYYALEACIAANTHLLLRTKNRQTRGVEGTNKL